MLMTRAAMSKPSAEPARENRILVVTDTPEDLAYLREQLGEAGFSLVQTCGMDSAMETVRADKPDIVLLDMAVLDSDAAVFCRDMRADAETEAIPLIVIVQERSEEQEEVALAMGADGFLCRPFKKAELVSRVQMLKRMKVLVDKVAEQNRELLGVNAELDRLNKEVTARNRELELGTEMARRLQEALLPQQYPQVENISFAHAYTSAEAIGGDVFQIIDMDEGRAAVIIADVSGHGVRAALVSSIVNTLIDYIDLNNKTPTEVLKDFNSRFRSVLGPMTPQIYATGIVMIVDGRNRRLKIADAGHPGPLLVSKRRMSAEPIIGIDDVGPALGFLSDPDYPTREIELSVGDIVLGFTDGIYEVMNEEDEMFGLKRLQDLVARNAHLVPRDLIQRILTETGAFLGTTRRPDDVCIVSVEVH